MFFLYVKYFYKASGIFLKNKD